MVSSFSQSLTDSYQSITELICLIDFVHSLIGLKNIFARQLPNMPKEYIVRLLMDRYKRTFF